MSVHPYQALLGFIIAALSSWIFVGLMRYVAVRYSVLDKPDNERKKQLESVPYLGGVGIVIAILFCLTLGFLAIPISGAVLSESLYLLIPCLMIGSVGLWDDLKNLTPHFRLMIQVLLGLVCSISITFGSTSGNITGNKSLDILVTIVWIVGITNAVNFFDNYDGGAAVATFMSSSGIALYSWFSGQIYIFAISVILMGVLFGFYIWNRNPAQIYMGDAGALFLGMLLASLGVRIDPIAESKIVALTIPILLMAIPILDTTTVVISRLKNGRSPMKGGRDHLSHRLNSIGYSPAKVLRAIAILSIYFQLGASITIFTSELLSYVLLSIMLLTFVFLLIWFLRIRVDYEF